ncbi:hypothetical protein PAXINDRAFT_117585 [Paxillus involutus ATCC 200175]|uniref:Phosphatidylglycerol/phosphatidylinositol transfer protein n=1 Tax=Paxillus involutus ATCC 200175 TaxID=664439 RepID=A0A0C9SUX8_PAXIN|nr:hypothetical protein PAXINDRAFT_117585 [Paxillus involutus ATCC 200175]
MYFLKAALSLALLAGSALAQSTQLTLPAPYSTLIPGDNVTVRVGMGGYPENIDVVAMVIGLAACYDSECFPPTDTMGTILYQGPYKPVSGQYYEDFTVTVPKTFIPGKAALNVINFFMVGASYQPNVQYLNETVFIASLT